MKTIKKILFSLLLYAVMIFTLFPIISAQADTGKFIDNPNWIDSTPAEVDSAFYRGDSFIVMYYRWSCFNSALRKTTLDQWMTQYGITVYGVDWDVYSTNSWVWSAVGESGPAPWIVIVENGSKITVVTASMSMRIAQEAINDMLGIIDTSSIDFYQANQYAFNSYGVSNDYAKQYLKPVASIDAQIVAQSNSIVNSSMTDYEKLRAIHDWVASNIYYDFVQLETGISDNSALAVLKRKTAVCEGYANLTADLCNAAGIPCRYVAGFAIGVGSDSSFPVVWNAYTNYLNGGSYPDFKADAKYSSNHAWNEAFVDGRWVILDTTWDSNNDYYGNGVITAAPSDVFFDPDLLDFSSSHLFFTNYQLGKVTGGGAINMQDVLMIYQSFRGEVSLTGDQQQAADVNGDGAVNMQDVLLVYQYFRGKITGF